MQTIMFTNIKTIMPGTVLHEGVEYDLKEETPTSFVLDIKTITGCNFVVPKSAELITHIREGVGHIHACMMAKYAHLAKYTKTPWKYFQVRKSERPNERYYWVDMTENDTFKVHYDYRLVKRIRHINGISFIEPERIPLEKDQPYWYPSVEVDGMVKTRVWDDDSVDYKCLKAGVVHTKREEAEKHARAIFTIGE